jgi:hypothetical protein
MAMRLAVGTSDPARAAESTVPIAPYHESVAATSNASDLRPRAAALVMVTRGADQPVQQARRAQARAALPAAYRAASGR